MAQAYRSRKSNCYMRTSKTIRLDGAVNGWACSLFENYRSMMEVQIKDYSKIRKHEVNLLWEWSKFLLGMEEEDIVEVFSNSARHWHSGRKRRLASSNRSVARTPTSAQGFFTESERETGENLSPFLPKELLNRRSTRQFWIVIWSSTCPNTSMAAYYL